MRCAFLGQLGNAPIGASLRAASVRPGYRRTSIAVAAGERISISLG
jgi:hypothetical protein